MKLNEYFDDLKSEKLSVQQKNNIYQKFLFKTEKIPFYKKTMFYVKTSVYCIFFVLLYTSFWSSIRNVQAPNTNFSQIMSGYFVGQTEESTNYVKASPLGKIIEITGDILINSGENLGIDFINKGDIVLIGQGANMKFQVNSGAMATISGPAKFSMETGDKDGHEIYVINLIYGDYFEIKSLNDSVDTGVVIKTDKFEITAKDDQKKMDIKIYSKGKKQIIQNNGGELILTKKVKDKDVTTSIKTNQKVEISQDEKMLAEVKTIENEFKEQKMQSSYSMTGEENQQSGTLIDFTGDVKAVLDEDQMSQIKTILDINSLNLTSRNMVIAYGKGDDEFLQTYYKTYLQKFSKIYEIIKIDFTGDVLKIYQKDMLDINDVNYVCKTLLSSINEKVYMTPKYTEIINKLCIQTSKLSKTEKGISKEELEFESTINKLGLEKEDFIIK